MYLPRDLHLRTLFNPLRERDDGERFFNSNIVGTKRSTGGAQKNKRAEETESSGHESGHGKLLGEKTSQS